MKRFLLLFVILFFVDFSASAQMPKDSAVYDITLQTASGTANRAGIAYNPITNYYYSINAGSGSYPIETYTETGTLVASVASSYSYRGLWWRPQDSTLEGKTHGTGGICQQYLDTSYLPLGSGTTIATGSGPNTQSNGDYDWENDEVLMYDAGSIFRYSRNPFSQISSVPVSGISITNLNNNTAVFTGLVGMEVGLYDHVLKRFYFIDKLTGVVMDSCQLPATAPAAITFQMGFDNDRLWLFDGVSRIWYGYLVITCNTEIALTDTACGSYVSPSGNYTWTISNVYHDTIYGSSGCDSIFTINLTIVPPLSGLVNDTICSYENITVNGTVYDAANPSGTEVFPNIGPYNCDSTVTISLSVLPAIDTTVSLASFTLTANQSGASYQWLDCDNAYMVIPGETAQSYTATVNGNYAVEITLGTCVDTSDCVNISGIGMDEFLNNTVEIYPNPTNGKINVVFEANQNSYNYSLYTIDGRFIEVGIAKNNLIIDLSKESPGVYFLKLNDDNFNRVYKVVKE